MGAKRAAGGAAEDRAAEAGPEEDQRAAQGESPASLEHLHGDLWALPNGFRLMHVGNGVWVNQFGSRQPLPKDATPLLLAHPRPK